MIQKIIRKVEKKFYRSRDKYIGRKRVQYLKRTEVAYGLNKDNSKNPKYIVSMASYSGRYSVLPITLKSLLCQKIKPDKIIVWLDKENEENQITEELEKLCKYGIEFRYTEDALKPHKKYLYVMKEFPKANIITVDDDVIYSEDLIESLMKAHNKYPNSICARRVHRISFDENGNINPYVLWDYEYRKAKKPSILLCATGGGGILYPSGILPEDTFDIQKIKELSLEADDMWLKVMELINHIPVVWVKSKYVTPLNIENSQLNALPIDNVGNGRNDMFLLRLFKEYPDAYRILKEEQDD